MKNHSIRFPLLAALMVSATLLSPRASACSAFEFETRGHTYLAKNHDFVMGEGLLVTNRRGIGKQAVQVAQPMTWVAKYGSVTYNPFGAEMPNGGMNEAGLVVEMLWLEEAHFASPDARKEVSALQWIQYQLDTAATVREVVASDAFLRINETIGKVHYIVADASGAVAVIELLDGKIVIHQDANLLTPVLANDVYSSCLTALQRRDKKSEPADATKLPSYPRFETLATVAGQQPPLTEDAAAYAWRALDRVRHPEYTQFQWVYDTAERRIFLRRKVDAELCTVELSAIDFRPMATAQVADLAKPGALQWTAYTQEINRAVIGRSYQQTPFLQHVPSEQLDRLAAIPAMYQAVN